ncbi:hypothetical protein ACILD6_07465 [Capnocytophaga canimorsus]|uniref:hypothetical protein n=1 Tax=Capnocytophaga canimorsus TaxID=28188 RepID=UPI0037CF33B5
MIYYSFNECFSKNIDFNLLKGCFSDTLKHYKNIAEKHPDVVFGILTDKVINDVEINKKNSLYDLVDSLDREEKRYAFSLLNKYPTEDFFEIDNIDSLIDNNYILSVDNCEYNAFSHKIISLYSGFLFSLGVHNDLKKNQLGILEKNNKESIALIDNLFGEQANTEYNLRQISNKIVQSKRGFDKLLTLFDAPVYDERLFKKEYEHLSVEIQNCIYDNFEIAKTRGLPTPFSADGQLIKDVTPQKENNIKVYELRVFKPICIRIYFYEDNGNIYLASITKKPAKNTQDKDIRTALSVIKSLIKTH